MDDEKNERIYVDRSGFALVSVVSLMAVLLVVVLAMLSLSAVELRSMRQVDHREKARANAKVALMMALGELQNLAGPDQRVTARADLLKGRSLGGVLDDNWLGVWRTTYASGGRNWPLMGKGADVNGGAAPYRSKGVYSDLRVSEPRLSEGKWREALLLGWLVSQREPKVRHQSALNLNDAHVVELVGAGTLGVSRESHEYLANRVLVEKVDIQSNGHGSHQRRSDGAYAWYVSDNNQKACISVDPSAVKNAMVSISVSQADNPTSLESEGGARPYASYREQARGKYAKLVSDQCAALLGAEGLNETKNLFRQALGADFHHLTTHGAGLMTDVTLGGFKKDLTPVLFGESDREIVTWETPRSSVAAHSFSSDDPIIPGSRHAVLGPSFGAFRSWGRVKSMRGFSSGVVDAQLDYLGKEALRRQSAVSWPYQVSDGVSFDAGKWASMAPKVRPVMTDVR